MTEPEKKVGYVKPADGYRPNAGVEKEYVRPDEENEGPMKWSLTEFLALRDASLICTTSEFALQTYADLLESMHTRIGAELKRLYPEEDHADQTAGMARQV